MKRGLRVAILLAFAPAVGVGQTISTTVFPLYADGRNTDGATPFAVLVEIANWSAKAGKQVNVRVTTVSGSNFLIWKDGAWQNAQYYDHCPVRTLDAGGNWCGWIFLRAKNATAAFRASAREVGQSAGPILEDASHTVTYMNMSTTGAWVEATAAASTAGLVILAYDASDNIIGAYAVEDNGVSEGYPSTAGYFKMAVPANTAIRKLEVRDASGGTVATQTSPLWGSGVAGGTTNLDDQYDVSLPVTLTSFQAAVVAGGVRLTWVTDSEINNRGFYVLRSEGETAPYRSISPLIPGAGSSVDPQSYQYIDRTVAPGQTYWYKLRQEDFGGQVELFGPVVIYVPVASDGQPSTVPTRTALLGGHPNPFNPGTTVQFALAAGQEVQLAIFDLCGRLVRALVQGDAPAGEHQARWDGRDDGGRDVPAGVYVCHLRCGDGYHASVKLLKLR
ncbi:MAG: FlgD immunoglobulin-like domain containing protein [bacterium]|nr:FlgD immunoglobulin-like domain containing protein [bacterium]